MWCCFLYRAPIKVSKDVFVESGQIGALLSLSFCFAHYTQKAATLKHKASVVKQERCPIM